MRRVLGAWLRCIGLPLAAMGMIIGLSGCAGAAPGGTGTEDVAAIVSQIEDQPGVNGAVVATTTNGVSSNKGFAAYVFVDEATADAAAVLRSTLEALWTRGPYEPSIGVSVAFIAGEEPDDPSDDPLQDGSQIDLSEAAEGLYAEIGPLATVNQGTLSVGVAGLAGLFGDWDDARR